MSTPGTLFSSAADVIVHSGSELDLRGAEALNSVSVNNGGVLYLHADFDANTVSNLGLLYVGETADQDTQTTLSNGGTLHQYSEITSAGNVINDGMWFLSANQTINVGTGLTGSGDFCLETFGNNVATCDGQSEAATAVTLTFNQTGNSTFDGRFVGLGTLDESGAGDLDLTTAQTFSNPTTGAPIQVHGVADGTADFDAVNVRQLYSGLAAVMAASTPELRLEPGKSSAAFGVGLYGGHSGVGFGVGHMFDNNTVLTFSAGKAAYSEPAYKASFSWTW